MGRDAYVVLLGCGRLGAILARDLSREGCSVVVIDRDATAFGRLDPEFTGFRLEGDGSETQVLRQARIGDADAFVAVTDEDNLNVMAAQIARRVFGVPAVIARISDPGRIDLCRDAGIDFVCPTRVAARAVTSAVLRAADSARGGSGQ